MERLRRDVLYAVRTLSRRPAFATVVVVTLALGIGAATSIFSVVNGVLLRPLPFPNPDRLVRVWEKRLALGRTRNVVSPADFMDWRDQNAVFSDMAAYASEGYNLTDRGEPERIDALAVTPGFFETLGVTAARGRTFARDEESPGHARVAIISHGLWLRRFGAGDIVGQTISLNDQPCEVVGIMPSGFEFSSASVDVWVPIVLGPEAREIRASHSLEVIGRLKPGVTIQQARAEMDSIAARLEQEYQVNTGHGANVFSLREEVVGEVQPALVVLACAVGLLLLIACANVANLQLARTFARNVEIAIRTALGASRSDIVKQLLTESIMVGLVAGVVGLLFSLWGVDLLMKEGAQASREQLTFTLTHGH
jgi:putative ABC transport system permease protein